MNELAAQVRRIAASDATTLILGETGTGKERIARAIHTLGSRARERWLPLNCAAIPPELLESELFGFSQGAFTGADKSRKGLFEVADGGTLFLDEIGDMKPSLQAKLTRVLEERAVRRLGDAEERPVNARVIAATHRDLEGMVRAGTFREDLWYRLNVAVLHMPPLRDRSDDIEMLAHHFLRQQLERQRGSTLAGFTHRALSALTSYPWPGNVRQLRSAVERASLLAEGQNIDVEDLPPEVRPTLESAARAALDAGETWAEALERGRATTARKYLSAVLERFEGRVAEAAAFAGVERESFYRLLRKYGVAPKKR